ncbi:MAG: hypothetical protein AB7O74_00250 [Candidatus Nanopelagicales bacterium]
MSSSLHPSRARRALLVPLVAGGLLAAGIAVADAATSASSLVVCLKRGAAMVAPTASGTCPTGYTRTTVVGARGPAGATGATGARGPAGATGAAGARGPQGDPGLDGADGSIGPSGPEGAAGAAGADGAQGPAGPEGPAGPQGPAGVAGPQGTAGADGTGPAWLDVGEATVYAASDTHTLATVSLPAGTYLLTAQVFVAAAELLNSEATVTCQWIVDGNDSLLAAQPPQIASPQDAMLNDVLALPTSAVTTTGASSAVSLRCAATSEGAGFTLVGTLVATRVSALTVT